MKCQKCGQTLMPGAQFCGNCGAPVPPSKPAPQPTVQQIATQPNPVPANTLAQPVAPAAAPIPTADYRNVPGPAHPFEGQVSNKNYMTTFLLACFLGIFGADRFYTNQILLGILKLITFGGFFIWAFIDVILVLTGNRKDKWGRDLYGRDKDFRLSLIIFIIVFALGVAGGIAQSAIGNKSAPPLPSSGGTSSQSTSNSSKSPSSAAAKAVGSTFNLTDQDGNKFEVTLLKFVAAAQPATSYDTPDAGKHFVAAQLKITNKSTKTLNEDPNNAAVLIDTKDQSYSVDFNQVADCQEFAPTALSNLNPQASATGCVVFQLPNTEAPAKVKYTPSSGFANNSGEWDVAK